MIPQQLNASLISSDLSNLGFGTKNSYLYVCVPNCGSEADILCVLCCAVL